MEVHTSLPVESVHRDEREERQSIHRPSPGNRRVPKTKNSNITDSSEKREKRKTCSKQQQGVYAHWTLEYLTNRRGLLAGKSCPLSSHEPQLLPAPPRRPVLQCTLV
jgi:hypothetical protein